MMKINVTSASLAAGVLLLASNAFAEQVAPGVDYALYNASGPNRVHVVAIDRLRPEYKLQIGWAQHKRNYTARENTSTIAVRYDQPPDRDVLAAVNGVYIDPVNLPNLVGTVASDGEIQAAPQASPDSEYDTFIIGASRKPIIRSAIRPQAGTLTFANGVSVSLDGYNQPNPPIHKITAYTPTWDTSTRSSFSDPSLAVEVILANVTYPMRGDKEISGQVTAIRTGVDAPNNPIPSGGMVLTAWGSALSVVLNNTHVGDRLRLRFATSDPWYNIADMAVAGIGWIIHEGAPYPANWDLRPAPYPYSRNPRTMLAWSDTKLFMVVCDGRWTGVSEGMTFAEAATFLTGSLGAIDAVNLDGGGSSTMWVNGSRRNAPEGGSWERPIGNAVLLVKQDTAVALPFADPFPASGRRIGWDDKFSDSLVVPFTIPSPGGDGYVIQVQNPRGNASSIRHGNLTDADYTVEADIYCEYRGADAGLGYERCGLFARDSGTGAFDLASYGGADAYMLSYDTGSGRLRTGKFVDGALTDFSSGDPFLVTTSGWHRFRIDVYGATIRYWIDGALLACVHDTSHPRGFFGIGHREYFSDDALSHGTRADNLSVWVDNFTPVRGDFDFDGDVDQEDFGHCQQCLSGTNQAQPIRACLDARLDSDDDVDNDDFALFQACVTAPGVPAAPACRN